jgi:hypothetical protein
VGAATSIIRVAGRDSAKAGARACGSLRAVPHAALRTARLARLRSRRCVRDAARRSSRRRTGRAAPLDELEAERLQRDVWPSGAAGDDLLGGGPPEHEARAPGFFYTDAISDDACAFVEQHCTGEHADAPFFECVAYTDRAARPRVAGVGAGRGDGGAVRRVGKAVRRARAGTKQPLDRTIGAHLNGGCNRYCGPSTFGGCPCRRTTASLELELTLPTLDGCPARACPAVRSATRATPAPAGAGCPGTPPRRPAR